MKGELHLIAHDLAYREEWVDLGVRRLEALLAIYNEFETFVRERDGE